MSTTLAATSWHLSAGSLVAGGLRGPKNGAGYGAPSLREGGGYGLKSSTLTSVAGIALSANEGGWKLHGRYSGQCVGGRLPSVTKAGPVTAPWGWVGTAPQAGGGKQPCVICVRGTPVLRTFSE